jgi:hypothetical protein
MIELPTLMFQFWRENLAGKFWRENLAGNFWREFLAGKFAANFGGKKGRAILQKIDFDVS